MSSFNNTSLREGTSCASRQSYFVNALGQRISSDVFCNNQVDTADASLQNLFAKNSKRVPLVSLIPPVEEFGRETMSSIPDEAQPLHQEGQEFDGRRYEQSAAGQIIQERQQQARFERVCEQPSHGCPSKN